ncbi:MAG TPA: DUF2868 domain-containing protein [Sulfurovum sp.]|jgi:hypothetical protein|nr:MAG: hypothetical protein B7Y63_02790 [Sulfurovum sp. 35-42-20]OYZ25912.1 MAG: hypothetical protein B7Y23_03605 [Sulfurovum sp. 16-42-52]OYZ48411.1 MAG: hypothetical protein B7Y13_07765 [Sulfurovum sp. 24-42-9]OZA46801.1 MAG: hypothetical protein B7X80_00995 [Sulfurovum sp. 17-42-90]OZA60001.1 MAG: hypothetical protein B7X69_05610 [Sulfurovum sp. 39-42-12]HQR73513.1 DUF2868 domain-containing protein [Sulfurovum sp.]
MTLESYLDFQSVVKEYPSSNEARRAFGIQHAHLKARPLEQILVWLEAHKKHVKKPLVGKTITSTLYKISLMLGLVSFFLGLFSGVGLLSYSGKEPVNVLYFMAMVIILPLFSMLLSLIAMLRVRHSNEVLVHLSPAFWMEKILSLLSKKKVQETVIDPVLANWIVIKRSQMLALLFSFGLLLALVATVVTKDIAFSWSTTLQIDAKTFYDFLYAVSLPWRELCVSGVPSLELIKQSHYFRLGNSLDKTMIQHPALLGEWWKFLALATVFYALFLRLLLLMTATFGLRVALKEAVLSLEEAKILLKQMNEPIITSQAIEPEAGLSTAEGKYEKTVFTLDPSYDEAYGWFMSQEQLLLLCESVGVRASRCIEAGAQLPLAKEGEIQDKSKAAVLCFVRAWEPPTMEIVDFLTELSSRADKVIVVPVGTLENQYRATPKELDVWDRKLTLLHHDKLWLKR